MQEVLGPDKEWLLGDSSGNSVGNQLKQDGGHTIMVSGAGGTVIRSAQIIGADSEVTMRLRLGAFDGKATSSTVTAGIPKVDGAGQDVLYLSLGVAAGSDQNSVDGGMSQLPGRKPDAFPPYTFRALPKSRLTWPAKVRDWAEEKEAQEAPLSERWLTVRYVLRKSSAQVYLDGRLLRDVEDAGLNPAGYFKIALSEGTQLSSLRMRKLPAENLRYEQISLDNYLNSSQFKASKIARDSLPQAGKETVIGGVPFTFPPPDQWSNDHIDVGASWMNFGFLEGGFDPSDPDTPRWAGPLRVEPGRIAFRVRNAPYEYLHLIASFDGEPDKIPVVSAQFYREASGHPVSFSTTVPAFTAPASAVEPLPVRLANGQKGNLYLITIPLEPQGLASLADQNQLVFELTKQVQVYRAYPDPCYYSEHGGGLPSGVHVFAMTLERPQLEVDFQPDKFAHLWTAPETPSYTIQLKNNTDQEQQAELTLSTVSHDGLEKTEEKKSVAVPPSGQQVVKWPITLKRYGYHSVEFQMKDEKGVQTQNRSLAYLHPDTREKKDWQEGEGPLWGLWDWNGGHGTPSGLPRLEMAVELGLKSSMHPMVPGIDIGGYPPEEIAYAEKNGLMTHFLANQLNPGDKTFLGMEFDAKKPAEMGAAVVAAIKKTALATPRPTNKPDMAVFFAEVLLGTVSTMSLPEYDGDPPYQLTSEEQANYQKYLDQFVISARAIKKEWPTAKCYFPYGVASFVIPYLRNSKEATELMDGPAVDQILFERLPEMQMGKMTYGTIFWQLKQEWIKAGKPWPPRLISIEGGGITSPATAGGLTMDQEADRTIRGELMLASYGVTQHLGWPSLFRCADAWGEQHYGSGLCEPLPLENPKVVLAAYATMTRQLDGMNYVKSVATGSASVFCLEFKHYQTGKLLHIFWTLRGKRPVSIEAGGKLEAYDSMDNEVDQDVQNQKTTFSIGTAPSYVWGLVSDPAMTLGQPDHSDAKPSRSALPLANLGDGSWKLSTARDADYETVNPDYIKKFPGDMRVQAVSAPAEAGNKALAVHLNKQTTERKVMPFYTTLVPAAPLTIPGKASHLGLWVKAASDWGRVVYCLKDATGQRWLSIGKKEEWNQDDPNCWSQFCFDGWRYLTFELPGNEPWDLFRDAGTSWWGYYGKGDAVVHLPLTLEKVIVERRTNVIKVDDLIPAHPDDVLLGGLYAEYRSAKNEGQESIRLSQLEMPVEKPAVALENPIQKMQATGTGTPITITKVVPPEHGYDGTACLVSFDSVPGAKSYDVWVSTKPDGSNAIQEGTGWTAPGQLLSGLPGNVALYLYVTYTDKDGKISKPSSAKRILLSDDFPFK